MYSDFCLTPTQVTIRSHLLSLGSGTQVSDPDMQEGPSKWEAIFYIFRGDREQREKPQKCYITHTQGISLL